MVLVVDDDRDVREVVQQALELEDHPTASASDGRSALEWLRHHPLPSTSSFWI